MNSIGVHLKGEFWFLLQKFNDFLQKISCSVRRTEKALKVNKSSVLQKFLTFVKWKLKTTQGTVNKRDEDYVDIVSREFFSWNWSVKNVSDTWKNM